MAMFRFINRGKEAEIGKSTKQECNPSSMISRQSTVIEEEFATYIRIK